MLICSYVSACQWNPQINGVIFQETILLKCHFTTFIFWLNQEIRGFEPKWSKQIKHFHHPPAQPPCSPTVKSMFTVLGLFPLLRNNSFSIDNMRDVACEFTNCSPTYLISIYICQRYLTKECPLFSVFKNYLLWFLYAYRCYLRAAGSHTMNSVIWVHICDHKLSMEMCMSTSQLTLYPLVININIFSLIILGND